MSSTATGMPPPGWRPSYDTCDEVSQWCRVEYTTLGYYPNLGVNAFLAAAYGLLGLLTLGVGVWKRTWGYSIAVGAGCILECVGYIGRSLLAKNPWNDAAFKMQIVAIVLGPTLVCVGLYLTLKHVVNVLNPSLSRFRPRLYPLFFVPADVSCLVIQAIGGGVAASAGRGSYSLLQHGNRTIMAGVALQVVVLGTFGALGGDFLFRVRRYFKSGAVAPEHQSGAAVFSEKKFRMFVWAMVFAFATLFIRCVYRIAEMAGGWGNHIMQDEPSFIVLESFMVLIACALLAIFAPGIFFPQMSHSFEALQGQKRPGTESDSAGMEMERV